MKRFEEVVFIPATILICFVLVQGCATQSAQSTAQAQPLDQTDLAAVKEQQENAKAKCLSQKTEIYSKAESGDAEAQFQLADWYLSARGGRDSRQAAEWYRLAAEQGHPKAQFAIANMYYHGIGVSRDTATGIEWYRKAAEQGDPYAARRLEKLEEIEWYRKAAEQGDPYAARNLGKLEEKEARREGNRIEFLRLMEAAKLGDPVAQYNLGEIYSHRASEYQTEQNLSTASTWFHKSADQGYDEGQFALGLMYETGTGGN